MRVIALSFSFIPQNFTKGVVYMALPLSLNEIIHAICLRNNNWFIDSKSMEHGDFELSDSRLILRLDLRVGTWILLSPGGGCFRILDKNQVGNEFIYTLEDTGDMTHLWSGTVYEMRLPLNFLKTAERVLDWANSDEAKPSVLAGETVAGVYTWRRASTSNGVPHGWQELFAKELSMYRRHMTGVQA